MAWLREGVEFVIGQLTVKAMPWVIAQKRACGHDEIDLAILKKYT